MRWQIGRALGPRGLRGELRFVLHPVDPGVLDVGQVLLGGAPHAIERLQLLGRGQGVLKLAGLDDRDAAGRHHGAPLEVEATWFAERKLPLASLLGAVVRSEATGEELGRVEGFEDNGAQVLLAIAHPRGTSLVPWVPALCPRAEGPPDGRVVILRPIEGLLDEA